MGVELIEKIRKAKKLKNYGIAKALREMGIEVTTQGIDAYEKAGARSMRLDILAGLYVLSGKKSSEFMEWLIEEFYPQTESKNPKK